MVIILIAQANAKWIRKRKVGDKNGGSFVVVVVVVALFVECAFNCHCWNGGQQAAGERDVCATIHKSSTIFKLATSINVRNGKLVCEQANKRTNEHDKGGHASGSHFWRPPNNFLNLKPSKGLFCWPTLNLSFCAVWLAKALVNKFWTPPRKLGRPRLFKNQIKQH